MRGTHGDSGEWTLRCVALEESDEVNSSFSEMIMRQYSGHPYPIV